jgi:hypothetical protein
VAVADLEDVQIAANVDNPGKGSKAGMVLGIVLVYGTID